jgi:hypothetical protein
MQFLKDNRRYLILCLVFGAISAQRFFLALVGFALFLSLLWLPVALFKVWRRPQERAARLMRSGIWLGVCAVVIATHLVRQNIVQAKAEGVAQTLLAYQSKHAGYPLDLSAAGLDSEALRREYEIHYWFHDGKPMLVYFSPMVPRFTFGYDFDQHRWQHLPD